MDFFSSMSEWIWVLSSSDELCFQSNNKKKSEQGHIMLNLSVTSDFQFTWEKGSALYLLQVIILSNFLYLIVYRQGMILEALVKAFTSFM